MNLFSCISSRLILNRYTILHKYNLHKNTINLKQCNEKSVISKFHTSLSSSFNIFKSSSINYNLAIRAAVVYENIADNLDYNYFYREFTMEDTLFSWFLVTEMHVWMLMLRIMQERDGYKIRNFIIEAMWNDVNIRATKLGTKNSTLIKSHIEFMYHQFNASIIGYDEAIGSTDKCLAGHIWRRFFKCENDNPEKLEKLVYYIRKQESVSMLSHTTTAEIFSVSPHILWIYV